MCLFICLALFVITDRVGNLTQRYKLMQKSLSLKDKEYNIMVPDWAKEMNCAVTVCDKEGIIIYMNDKAKDTFAKHGDLIGKSLIPCHNDNSRSIIAKLLETGGTNAYTIQKNGLKKMIYQTAWKENGEVAGLVEISMVIPEDLPHYIR